MTMMSDSSDLGGSVQYSCLRCGTKVSNTELDRLPEIKCICGFRVFVKVRPPLDKELEAV